MKRLLIALIATAVVAGFSTVALAAVQGTHHDMATYVGAGRDTCYPCHGYKETAAGDPLLKTVGSMCYTRCHIGGAGAAAGAIPLATAMPEIGVFNNTDNTLRALAPTAYPGGAAAPLDKYRDGHKMLITAIPMPDTAAMVNGTGWPYASASTGMECTTCHDVHENANTPFLRAPLSTPLTDNSSATRQAVFCHRCHQPYADGAARWADLNVVTPNGSHPSEADWQFAGTRSGARLPRSIDFRDRSTANTVPAAIGDNAVFRNWSYRGAELNSNANHYNPGGKLGDFRGTGAVGCYTCHATHLPAQAQLPQLIVARYRAGLTPQLNQSDMCVGCHGRNGRTANPGLTDYYHPVDTETIVRDFSNPATAVYTMSTGTDNIVVDMSGVYDNSAGGRLSCMSCHAGRTAAGGTPGTAYGVHYGTAGVSILSPAKADCASCHNLAALQAGTTPNSHHVYGGRVDYTTIGYPTSVTFSGSAVATLNNGLSCEDCHIGNGTAHNWN